MDIMNQQTARVTKHPYNTGVRKQLDCWKKITGDVVYSSYSTHQTTCALHHYGSPCFTKKKARKVLAGKNNSGDGLVEKKLAVKRPSGENTGHQQQY